MNKITNFLSLHSIASICDYIYTCIYMCKHVNSTEWVLEKSFYILILSLNF